MSVTLAELNSIWCREYGVAECHDTAMALDCHRMTAESHPLLSEYLRVSAANGIRFERLYLIH